jgi:hypothetical protein
MMTKVREEAMQFVERYRGIKFDEEYSEIEEEFLVLTNLLSNLSTIEDHFELASHLYPLQLRLSFIFQLNLLTEALPRIVTKLSLCGLLFTRLDLLL